jgi:hypothetical protein
MRNIVIDKSYVLVAAISLCLLVVVCLGCELESTKNIESFQKEKIKISQYKIKTYQATIDELQKEIHYLVDENCRLQNLKEQVYVKTIVQVDSVYRLPFHGKSNFFSEQIASLDTLRNRYVSRN